MTTAEYQQRMKALGVERGALAPSGAFRGEACYSTQGKVPLGRVLLRPKPRRAKPVHKP